MSYIFDDTLFTNKQYLFLKTGLTSPKLILKSHPNISKLTKEHRTS